VPARRKILCLLGRHSATAATMSCHRVTFSFLSSLGRIADRETDNLTGIRNRRTSPPVGPRSPDVKPAPDRIWLRRITLARPIATNPFTCPVMPERRFLRFRPKILDLLRRHRIAATPAPTSWIGDDARTCGFCHRRTLPGKSIRPTDLRLEAPGNRSKGDHNRIRGFAGSWIKVRDHSVVEVDRLRFEVHIGITQR